MEQHDEATRIHADVAEHTSPAPRTRRTFGLGILAGAVGVALGVGFGAGWLSHGSGTGSDGGSLITVHGTLQLTKGGFYSELGTTCTGSGGYQDISAGVAVTIGDQAGKTLAITNLQGGHVIDSDKDSATCRLTFSAQVPSSATLYTVTISHRGTQTFQPADIAGGFNMTLGGN